MNRLQKIKNMIKYRIKHLAEGAAIVKRIFLSPGPGIKSFFEKRLPPGIYREIPIAAGQDETKPHRVLRDLRGERFFI